MTFLKRLISTLVVPVLLFATLLGLQLGLLAYVQDSQKDRATYAQIRHELLRLERMVAEVDKAFRGYVLVRQTQLLEPMLAAERQVPEVLATLADLTAPWPDFHGRVRVLTPRVREFLSVKRQLTHKLGEGEEDGVLLYIRTGEGVALANTVSLAFQDLDRRVLQREKAGELDQEEKRVWSRAGLVATTLGTFGLGMSLGRLWVACGFLLPAASTRSPHRPI